jgi:hypothetical protein
LIHLIENSISLPRETHWISYLSRVETGFLVGFQWKSRGSIPEVIDIQLSDIAGKKPN